jgi:hypothetical protein
MPRPCRSRAIAAALALFAAGCQNYNFNPAGQCLAQPGSDSYTLSNVSSADLLFVVDDSNSMYGKQLKLAAAFDDFIEDLTSTNRGLAASGLLPLDFHIATTTTSVFYNRETTNQSCHMGCAGAGATTLACCVGGVAQFGPRACKTKGARAAECPKKPGDPGTTTQTTCSDTCTGMKGDLTCCYPSLDPAVAGTFDAWMFQYPSGDLVTCDAEGLPCGDLQTHYAWAQGECDPATQGVALKDFPYPDGNFVGSTNVANQRANPRVLHFDKRLYWSETAPGASPGSGQNAQGFTLAQLKTFFRQNVAVGTCGSPQEQGLLASRHAIEKALSGLQRDTYDYDRALGQAVPTGTLSSSPPLKFSAPGGIPTAQAAAAWPTPGSKLVIVYVGDEDDCSSPQDPAGGVVLQYGDLAGADACVRDVSDPTVGGKETLVSSFVNYFTGLGRGLGAGFVVSAATSSGDPSCSDDTCTAQKCCDSMCSASCPTAPGDLVCGGQAPGVRFLDMASKLKSKGADVVVGSVCGDFQPLLRGIAQIVKPPRTLSLPTAPAEEAITILRIALPSNETRKICGRPLPPVQPNGTRWPDRKTAEATGADWWFTNTANADVPWDPTLGTTAQPPTVAIPTKFVYINPLGNCKANPGETYSADYLGRVPADGCVVDPATDYDPAGTIDPETGTTRIIGSTNCQEMLGRHFSDWACYIPPPGPPLVTKGTCSCRPGG